jgi:ABC-type nitrate/sulfonate/bicarbonate transport system substrate-binding protein
VSSRRRRRSPGWWLVTGLFVLAAALSVVASRVGWVERVRDRLHGRGPRLSPSDFPVGVLAPVDDVVKLPSRAVVIGLVPRGSSAALLWAGSGSEHTDLFRTSYALDVRIERFEGEDELRKALAVGAEAGGVDLAVLPVSSVAMSASLLREATPKVVLLLGRSRGQEVLAAKRATRVAELVGKRIAVEERGAAWYFLLWTLSRAGLSLRDVELVPVSSTVGAGDALRGGQVDAVAGLVGDIEPSLEGTGQVLASTADAPHLLATVLVARGDFAARFPDAVRRIVRASLDANTQVLADRTEAARVLGTLAPRVGDPMQAIAAAPPSTLKENLAFFALSGEAPVTYGELFDSAAALNHRVFGAPPAPQAGDAVDLSALKYVATPQPP